jgi:glycosyltransferase involved in cell wall biosynthesis
MTIDIILGTYNGEKYLREQVESILAQTIKDWRLLIRDDGSNDGTVAIIQDYVKHHPGKIIQVDPDGENLGVVANFGRLMEVSSADYVMFCDQDDVWYPDKIARSYGALLDMEVTYGNQVPLLVHTDARLVDEQMNPTHDSFHRALSHEAQRTSLAYELIQNTAHGCTIIMNRALLALAVPMPAEARMHDMWVHLMAQSCGYAEYLDVATLDYRQHGKNVIGAIPEGRGFHETRRKARETFNASVRQAEALQARIGEGAYPDAKQVVHAFLSAARQSWLKSTITLLGTFCPKPTKKNAARIVLR